MKRTLTMLLAGLLLLSAVSCGVPAEDTDPAAAGDPRPSLRLPKKKPLPKPSRPRWTR